MAEQRVTTVFDTKSDLTGLKAFSRSLNGTGRNIRNVGLGISALAAPAIAFGVKAVKAFNESAAASKKLETILLHVEGNSLANAEALNKQADALQAVGVQSDDSITAAQTMLASFDLQGETIEKLIPSLLDFATAEKGMNISQEEAASVAQGLGKALQGQTDILKESGFQFSEQQKWLLENGTETERVNELTKILDSTYGGLNEEMRKTSEGGMVGLQLAFDKFTEDAGGAIADVLKPLADEWLPKISGKLTEIATWATENPEKMKLVMEGFVGLAATGTVLTTFGLVIQGVSKGIGGVRTALDLARGAAILFSGSSTLGMIGLTGVITGALYVGITKIKEGFEEAKISSENFDKAVRENNPQGILDEMHKSLDTMKSDWWNAKGLIAGATNLFNVLGLIKQATEAKPGNQLFDLIYNKMVPIMNMAINIRNILAGIVGGATFGTVNLGIAKEVEYRTVPTKSQTGNQYGPALAGGGHVFGSNSYIVGDAGEPEVFTPDQSGTVTPMNKLENAYSAESTINNSEVNIYQEYYISEQIDMTAAMRELGWRLTMA